jgi:hypothetical protein
LQGLGLGQDEAFFSREMETLNTEFGQQTASCCVAYKAEMMLSELEELCYLVNGLLSYKLTAMKYTTGWECLRKDYIKQCNVLTLI